VTAERRPRRARPQIVGQLTLVELESNGSA